MRRTWRDGGQAETELAMIEQGHVRHRLPDMLLIALCTVICGTEGWEDFEDFAESKAKWFATFMDLQHRVPSADTFRRVFSRLDPDAFESGFTEWMQSVVALSGGKLVAIDGKSIRRSFDHAWDKSGMTHMVSAFVAENAQVFSQVKADNRNELKAITQLLGLIDLRDAIVSIDAAGCQARSFPGPRGGRLPRALQLGGPGRSRGRRRGVLHRR